MMDTEAKKEIRRVLIATDFSQNAGVALDWAWKIARAHNADLRILHVAHVNPSIEISNALRDSIEYHFGGICEKLGESFPVENVVWQKGKPWEVIAAESRSTDLVVIGARGQSPEDITSRGLGSTADRVLRSSHAPVFTVHVHDVPSDTWPRRILVPTDFSETARRAVEFLPKILWPESGFKTEITLLYAWQTSGAYSEMYGAAYLPYLPDHRTVSEASLETLAAQLRSSSIAVRPVLKVGEPVRVIMETIKELEVELVAMGTHGHSGLARFFLGSVAERVVHRSNCPILTVGPR